MTKKFSLDKGVIIFFILAYIVINLIYSFVTNTVWDDDCPTRYYNTLNAFNDPKMFISLWNRPLFTIIFAGPVQLGKWTIPVLMVIISVIASIYLYRGLIIKQVKNAYMIIPLMLFQTYYFSISRDVETEPLAVALICFGYYFFAKKNWLAFAIAGSLMPLARLELSVLLIFWVYILFKEKQFKYILMMAIPLVLWNIAGGIIEGDFNYVMNKTLNKDNATNRYGHTTFGHYFQRYIYVVGPAVFFFFIFGLTNAFRRMKFSAFVYLQFITGFMLYVIFSWKLNMGNAAGFLRNLIPLTPLTAIIALEGFNFLGEAISSWKKSESASSQTAEVNVGSFSELSDEEFQSLNRKKRQSYLKQKKEHEEKTRIAIAAQKKSNKTFNNNRTKNISLLFLIGFVIVLLSYFFFTLTIRSHHKLIEDTFTWVNIGVVSGMFLLTVLSYFMLRNRVNQNYTVLGSIIGVVILLHTTITEPPNMNNSPERDTMAKVSDVYVNGYLNDKKTYVNHIWFFWSNELDKFDEKYDLVTMANLDSAEAGSICLWENHYSHRLAGDVQAAYFTTHPKWIELNRYISSDKKFQCAVYEKVDSVNRDGLEKINQFIAYQPKESTPVANKALFYMKNLKKSDSAKVYFQKALDLDSTNWGVYFNRGLLYFQNKEFNDAIVDFNKCTKQNPKWHQAWGNLGAAYINLQNYEMADSCLTEAIDLKKDFANGYQNRAKLYVLMKNETKALQDYGSFLNLQPKNEQARLARAQIYFNQKDWGKCIGDVDAALNVNPNNANGWFFKGICHINLKQVEQGCSAFQKSYQLGNQNALQYLNQYCGKQTVAAQ